MSLIDTAIKMQVSTIKDANGDDDMNLATNVNVHVFCARGRCVVFIPKGGTSEEMNCPIHSIAKRATMGFESLNTARIRKKNSRELSGAAKAPNHPADTANA